MRVHVMFLVDWQQMFAFRARNTKFKARNPKQTTKFKQDNAQNDAIHGRAGVLFI
jgi:hypothetical protein